MSHARSFQYMSVDELCLKQRTDEYRLQTLQQGVLTPLKRWGLGGVDEAMHALGHKLIPGKTAQKISYFQTQIEANTKALQDKVTRHEATSDEVNRLLRVEPNPATLSTLKHYREKLRRERIERMKYAGEKLYGKERLQYSRKRLADAADATTDALTAPFGAVGDWIAENRLLLFTALSIGTAGYSGYRWLDQHEIYKPVAARYVASSEVGPIALPLKRQVAEMTEDVQSDLVYIPEITATDSAGNEYTVVPEMPSTPQPARFKIIEMTSIVNSKLSPTTLSNLHTVSLEERTQLGAIRDQATSSFERASNSLTTAIDPTVTYAYEIGLVTAGNSTVKEAVPMLERHMPKDVVEDENHEYNVLTQWKWMTRIFGFFGVVGALNLARGARRRHYY
jgi:hypothetical protein